MSRPEGRFHSSTISPRGSGRAAISFSPRAISSRRFLFSVRRSIKAEGLPGLSRQELERQDAHPDEVGAMDALKALGDHRADAQELDALGGPVARGARAVFFAGHNDQGHALGPVGAGGVIDRRLGAVREVAGPAAFRAG